MATLNPYISFNGQAKEALEFYSSVLGGKVEIMTFGDLPEMGAPAELAHQVMHGSLTFDDGRVLMASDTPPGMDYVPPTAGVTIAITSSDPADHEIYADQFAKLSAGGTAGMPFDLAPWGDYFGQFDDKFGVSWMFDVAGPESAPA
jgi:PhnB protein